MENNEPTEEEFYNEIWAEISDEMDRYHDEISRINNRIFKAIENQIGKGFLLDLKTLIEDSGCIGSFLLVESSNITGKFQSEHESGCITGIWVYQYSVADTGDSFAGTIWVKLKSNKYLQMYFAV